MCARTRVEGVPNAFSDAGVSCHKRCVAFACPKQALWGQHTGDENETKPVIVSCFSLESKVFYSIAKLAPNVKGDYFKPPQENFCPFPLVMKQSTCPMAWMENKDWLAMWQILWQILQEIIVHQFHPWDMREIYQSASVRQLLIREWHQGETHGTDHGQKFCCFVKAKKNRTTICSKHFKLFNFLWTTTWPIHVSQTQNVSNV